MFERIFTPVLAFMLLAGGTFAVGSELFAANPPARVARAQMAVIRLPTVEVNGHRIPAPVAMAETDAGRGARNPLQ